MTLDAPSYPPAPCRIVSTAVPNSLSSLSTGTRVAAAIVAVTMLGLLAIASRLEPDPSGYGTHRQLGLLPCTFKWLVGRPCPSCGMTTSWAHVMHGQLAAALHANAGGTALALVSLVCGPWLLVSAVRGRWWVLTPTDRLVATVAIVLAAITLVDWCRRLNWWW